MIQLGAIANQRQTPLPESSLTLGNDGRDDYIHDERQSTTLSTTVNSGRIDCDQPRTAIEIRITASASLWSLVTRQDRCTAQYLLFFGGELSRTISLLTNPTPYDSSNAAGLSLLTQHGQ